MESGYHILEHPADTGVESWGRSFGEALAASVDGLIAILVDPSTIQSAITRPIDITSTDRESLVVRTLSEVLYCFDGEGFVPSRLIVDSCTDRSLKGKLVGEHLRIGKHRLRTDVKAATYHQLSVRNVQDGVRLRVFFDI